MFYIVFGAVCCILAIIVGTIIALYDRPRISEENKLVTKGLSSSEEKVELSKALENLEPSAEKSVKNEKDK